MVLLLMVNVHVNQLNRQVSVRAFKDSSVLFQLLLLILFLMFIYHRLFQNLMRLFECFHCVFELTSCKAYFRHDQQSFGHFRMNDFLIVFSGILDDFLTL